MYNSEQKKGHQHQYHHNHFAPMNPRISFSNDFVESKQAMRQERGSSRSETTPPPVSSDFEFSSSVTNYSMMSSADELLFKGRLLPYKDNNNQMHRATTTLREELLVDDDDESQGFSLKPQKGSSTKWKGFLGLRKSHIGPKNKANSCEGSSDRVVEARRSPLVNEGSPLSQEMLNEGGSSCGDLEIGLFSCG